MRSGTNSSKCGERQKDQLVIGLAQALLTLTGQMALALQPKNKKITNGRDN
jgi:hypothetical protein